MNFMFVWPFVTFIHTNQVCFGYLVTYTKHKVAKSVNKCDHMVFRMKKRVFCVTIDHPMAT